MKKRVIIANVITLLSCMVVMAVLFIVIQNMENQMIIYSTSSVSQVELSSGDYIVTIDMSNKFGLLEQDENPTSLETSALNDAIVFKLTIYELGHPDNIIEVTPTIENDEYTVGGLEIGKFTVEEDDTYVIEAVTICDEFITYNYHIGSFNVGLYNFLTTIRFISIFIFIIIFSIVNGIFIVKYTDKKTLLKVKENVRSNRNPDTSMIKDLW